MPPISGKEFCQMSNKIIMPDAESLQSLIELTKENPAAALEFLTFMQSDLIYELTKETNGAE
jgi:hypothetical protein